MPISTTLLQSTNTSDPCISQKKKREENGKEKKMAMKVEDDHTFLGEHTRKGTDTRSKWGFTANLRKLSVNFRCHRIVTLG